MLIIENAKVGTNKAKIAEVEQGFIFGDGVLSTYSLPLSPSFPIPFNTRMIRLTFSQVISLQLEVQTTADIYTIMGMVDSISCGTTVGEQITGIEAIVVGTGGFLGLYTSQSFRVRNSPREWNV